MLFRSTKRLQFEIHADPRFDTCAIPPLTLQPFVENAIVHGFTDPAKPLEIRVSVGPDDQGDASRCRIRIEDNGRGFSPALLQALSNPEFLQTGETRHIGIWNVVSRLEMTFGNSATLHFSNRPTGGACIELHLPCGRP